MLNNHQNVGSQEHQKWLISKIEERTPLTAGYSISLILRKNPRMFFEMVQDLRKQANQKSASAGQGAVPVSSEASAAHGAVLAASGGVSHAAPAAVLSAGSAAHAGPSAAPTLHPDRATENKQWLKVLCLDKIFSLMFSGPEYSVEPSVICCFLFLVSHGRYSWCRMALHD